jgi:hypothetical protein
MAVDINTLASHLLILDDVDIIMNGIHRTDSNFRYSITIVRVANL